MSKEIPGGLCGLPGIVYSSIVKTWIVGGSGVVR